MTDRTQPPGWGFSSGERKLFTSVISFAGVFLVVLALPAFTGNKSEAVVVSEAASVQEISVVMTEFQFEPAVFEFSAGDRVRFVIENKGQVTHEFRLTSRAAAQEHAEGGHADHDDGASAVGEDIWVEAAPGEVKSLEVEFSTDTTFDIVACLLPGHYEAGMTRPLMVHGATSMFTAADADHEDSHAQDDADHEAEDAVADDHKDSHDGAEADHEAEDALADDHEDSHDEAAAEHDPIGSDEPLSDVDREIVLTMTEFAFEPSSIEVSRGETIRFVLDNQGFIQHEFRLSTEHAVEEHLASGHEGHGPEPAAEGHGHGDVIVLVAGGEIKTVEVTFDEHSEFDILACLLPDHYEAGMSAAFTIGV